MKINYLSQSLTRSIVCQKFQSVSILSNISIQIEFLLKTNVCRNILQKQMIVEYPSKIHYNFTQHRIPVKIEYLSKNLNESKICRISVHNRIVVELIIDLLSKISLKIELLLKSNCCRKILQNQMFLEYPS